MATDPDREDERSANGSGDENGSAGTPEGAFARGLLESATDAVLTVESDATIVFANPAVETVFGYPPEELVGRSLTTIVPESMNDRLHETVDRRTDVGENHEDWRDVRVPGRRRDGSTVQLSFSFFTHGDGEYLSAIVRDVTDRVRREAHLETRNERLTRLASVLSHDLREPLHNAQAKLTLAMESGEEEYIREVMTVTDRMAELIEDVLTLTTGGDPVGDTEPVDLGAVVGDAAETVDTDGLDLSVEGSLSLSADRERLRTLLENMIGNAARHGGSAVTVRVGPLDDDAGFFVADDGPGIPAEDRQQVFEYGYTTSEDGTGLGLSIVREIAAAHGWESRITESASGGARFEFDGVETDPDEAADPE